MNTLPMFLRLFSTIVFLSAEAFAQQAMKLSLEESVEIGLNNSKILHASLMQTEVANARASEVNTTTLPTLKFGGQYTRLSDVPPFVASIPAGSFGGGLPAQSISFPLSQTVLDNYNLRLTALQPLFTGFRLSSTKEIADQSAKATGADYRRDKANLIFNIKNSYWNLFKAKDFKKVIDETVEQVNSHLTDVNNLMKQGMATTNDVLRVEVQLSNTKILQIDAASNVRLATIGLNTIMGQNLTMQLDLVSHPDSAASDSAKKTINDYNEMVRRALEHRPEFEAMHYRVNAGEAAVTLAKSGWYPQLYVSGNYYYAKPNQRYVPTQNTFNNSWDINLTAAIDIWNWGATIDQTHQAQAQLQQSKDILGQLQDNISLEVAQSLLNLNQASERIGVADQAVNQASENHRITSEKYKLGLVLNSDVVDAQLSLLLARTTYTQSLVDYQIALAKLQQSIGE